MISERRSTDCARTQGFTKILHLSDISSRHLRYSRRMILHVLATILLMGAVSSGAAEFVGTSPCGGTVREFVGILKTEPCDKITWLLNVSPDANTFTLTATYGLQEQSAPGFINRGKTATFEGALKISRTNAQQIYTIKPDKSERTLSLLHVNENLLQLLGPDGRLLVGNEFWSYTLNRKTPAKAANYEKYSRLYLLHLDARWRSANVADRNLRRQNRVRNPSWSAHIRHFPWANAVPGACQTARYSSERSMQ
jgi:hypothetical protein